MAKSFSEKKSLLSLTLISAPGIVVHLCYLELGGIPDSVVLDAALKLTVLLQPACFACPIQHLFGAPLLLISTRGKKKSFIFSLLKDKNPIQSLIGKFIQTTNLPSFTEH